MDYDWTPSDACPKLLYRVCHPQAWTLYFPRAGLISSLMHANNLCRPLPPPLTYTAYEISSFRCFLKSIRNHCNQSLKPSPWISNFASKREAEMWCLAAEDMFGEECHIMVIDTEVQEMKDAFWLRVEDVVAKIGDAIGMADVGSECLVFGHIPKEAIREKDRWIYGHQIRARYGYQTRRTGLAQMLSDPREDVARIPKYDSTLFEFPKWNPNYKPVGMDDCDCEHVDVCMHFDWDFGTAGQNSVQAQEIGTALDDFQLKETPGTQ